MINLLKRCLAPPSSVPTSAEERVDAQARALETLAALDNVFGGLTLAPAKKVESDHGRSVSEWSTELDQPTSEILADPAASSPYNGDPNTVVIFHQGSLEYEYSSASDSDSTSTTTSLSSLHDSGSFDSATPSDTKIRFASTVSVVEIPSHRDMPRDIVESVWTATHELHHNGRRSVQEWNWDGRDWANALEEHEMIYDPTTGAYIHPATWHAMEREREEEEALELQLELERLHQAMEEAVQREQIRVEANRRMKIKERRRRKTKRQTVKKMVSPKISTRRSQPIGPIVEQPASGGSLTRFADT